MLKAYLIKPRSAADYFVDMVCFLAFIIALTYLIGKVYSLAAYAGNDFKFLWLADKV